MRNWHLFVLSSLHNLDAALEKRMHLIRDDNGLGEDVGLFGTLGTTLDSLAR